MKHLQKIRITAALLSMALLLGSCGTATPQSGGQNAAGGALTWEVTPQFTFDSAPVPLGTEENPNVYTGMLNPYYYGLSFFMQHGKTGMINDAGTIVAPIENNVQWCNVCSVVSDDHGTMFYPDGRMGPTGGHGGNDIYYVYSEKQGKALEYSYSWVGDKGFTKYWAVPAFLPVHELNNPYTLNSEVSDMSGKFQNKYALVGSDGQLASGENVQNMFLQVRQTAESTAYLVSPYEFYAGFSAEENNCVQFMDGSWGYVDAQGHTLLSGYEEARPFHEGLAAVCKNGKWGYIDTAGNSKLDFVLEDAASVFDGAAWAKQNGQWGVLRLVPATGKQGWRTFDLQQYIDAINVITGGGNVTIGESTTVEDYNIPANIVVPDNLLYTENNGPHCTVNADGGLRLRSAPSTEAEKLLVIPNGTFLVELGYNNNDAWVFVKYDGQYGWVNTEFLTYEEGGMAKPVLYLYPPETTDVNVQLTLPGGSLTCTYPAYHDGWQVRAQPNGTLTNKSDGKEYSYLYWEGVSNTQWNLQNGFVVAGADTAAFLQETLAYMGLTPREYNEFIVYWLPQMQNNAYNLITFQTDAYTNAAPLHITPQPDSMLRVFMAFKPLTQKLTIAPQTLTPWQRTGFAVVEWGGTKVA